MEMFVSEIADYPGFKTPESDGDKIPVVEVPGLKLRLIAQPASGIGSTSRLKKVDCGRDEIGESERFPGV
jgi:hypothetical protein